VLKLRLELIDRRKYARAGQADDAVVHCQIAFPQTRHSLFAPGAAEFLTRIQMRIVWVGLPKLASSIGLQGDGLAAITTRQPGSPDMGMQRTARRAPDLDRLLIGVGLWGCGARTLIYDDPGLDLVQQRSLGLAGSPWINKDSTRRPGRAARRSRGA
jgi:hypothetical protein